MSSNHAWKKGRGKLGFLSPLLGTWPAHADSPQGQVYSVHTFSESSAWNRFAGHHYLPES